MFQGLQGIPGPKVRLSDLGLIQFEDLRNLLLSGFCVLLQGEPGYGFKGDKGDTGAPGQQVSEAESL